MPWTDSHAGELESELAAITSFRAECEAKLGEAAEIEAALQTIKANNDINNQPFPDERRVTLFESIKTRRAALK